MINERSHCNVAVVYSRIFIHGPDENSSEVTGYLIFIFILQITLSSKLLDLIPITMHMKMIMAKVIGVLIQIRQKIHSFCMHSFESFDFISHPLF